MGAGTTERSEVGGREELERQFLCEWVSGIYLKECLESPSVLINRLVLDAVSSKNPLEIWYSEQGSGDEEVFGSNMVATPVFVESWRGSLQNRYLSAKGDELSILLPRQSGCSLMADALQVDGLCTDHPRTGF